MVAQVGSTSTITSSTSSSSASVTSPSTSPTIITPISTATTSGPSSSSASNTVGPSSVTPGNSSTTAINTQVFTVNSTAPGKHYITSTLQATANATSVGPLPVAFITYTEKESSTAGVSPGATAGIAIATLLIGALIATAAMLVVQRKKRRKSKPARLSAYASSGGEHGPVQAVAASTHEKSVATNNATDPDYLLPQPKDDQSMASSVTQLFVHIGDHVENFYHRNPLRENVTPQTEEDELLISRRTRHAAIKRYISREMIMAIGWQCNPAHSLLSAQAVSMAQQMAKGNLTESTYEVAWSRWRVSVGLLLKNQDQSQIRQAREHWVGQLQTKLRSFQTDSPEEQGELQRDLYAICDLAEKLAVLICSQPARWEFEWPRNEGRKDFVIFPELVRTTDSKARRLDRPNRVLDAHRMQ